MQPIILVIDEGTTNAKAICLGRDGQILGKGSKPLKITHPKPAWAEQNPNEIIDAVQISIQEALAQGDFKIEGIGISNQRESILIWDRKTGKALTPVAVWQCRRSEDFCATLAKSAQADIVRAKTGLPIDPLFPAAKMRWLIDSLPDGQARAEAGEICIGTIDSWLVWILSGCKSFVTDMSNASRTQLFNIHNQQWDAELCKIFDVPMAALAQVLPSSLMRAETLGFAALPDGLPILSQIGDSHAALYGQGGFQPGVIKATYGTGSSLMTPVNTVAADDFRLASTIAWNDGALTYGLEGNITHTGAGAAYIGKLIGQTDIQELSNMAEAALSSNGVYFVPALSGLAAPHWQSAARGIISGLTDSAEPKHIARAGFEAVAFQVADVFFLMEEMSGTKLERLLVDGGPTQNTWLMQFQANIIERPVVRNGIAEISALGAGYLAGMELGWWPNREALNTLERDTEVIYPNDDATALKDRYKGWKQAIKQTLSVL